MHWMQRWMRPKERVNICLCGEEGASGCWWPEDTAVQGDSMPQKVCESFTKDGLPSHHSHHDWFLPWTEPQVPFAG